MARAATAPKRAPNAKGNARRQPRVRADEPIVAAPRPIAAPPRSPLRRLLRTTFKIVVRGGIAVGLAYGTLIGVREGYAYATTSPRFEVRGLEFRPTTHVDDAHLRQLLALPPGTNILSLELDGLAERITADPWVARATVNRELPDTLRVEIEEHQPIAVLAAGALLLVSREGEPFKQLEPGERGQLPVVTGVTGTELVADPEGARARIGRAIEAIDAYATKRRPLLSEIHVDTLGGVTLYTAQVGAQLRLGRGDIAAALARYDALRAAMGEESDKLAVAHLDEATRPDRPERVVASFFPAKDVPELVTRAQERAAMVTQQEDQAEELTAEAERTARKLERAKRIPRHH
ncbi:MAG TPA: FtsQ-type POTRA domain-containing protein [Nannocystaceae bacterium]|nr:FtsQ-type POTRA domain-containing protein [Nannocystaceae bacterium]